MRRDGLIRRNGAIDDDGDKTPSPSRGVSIRLVVLCCCDSDDEWLFWALIKRLAKVLTSSTNTSRSPVQISVRGNSASCAGFANEGH